MTSDPARAPRLTFLGGRVGALAPFGLFIAGVAWLGISGAPDERGLWAVLLAALIAGLVLARNRSDYADAVIAGMAQPLVMLMICAWLFAGVLGTLLARGGLVDALVAAAHAGGFSGGGYVAASFVACALVSTATGTSIGTLLVAGPLLYPAGAAAAADPGFLIGAIVSGATFGDNVSPLSDTTIASAGTQHADLGGVVRSRWKYAWPVAAAAVVVFAAFGGGVSGGAGAAPAGDVSAWPMLAVPAFVIVLLVRRHHLFEGLLFGIVVATILGLALGRFAPADLLHVDPEVFGARGLLIDGLEKAVGISVFTLLLVGLVAGLEASGVVAETTERTFRRVDSRRGAEAAIVTATSAATVLTTHSVVALLAVGELARDVGIRFGVSGYRRANLMDMTVCTYPFLLPYCIPTILAAALTADAGAFGMPAISPLAAGMHNVYSLGLLAMLGVSIAGGYGRDAEEKTQ